MARPGTGRILNVAECGVIVALARLEQSRLFIAGLLCQASGDDMLHPRNEE